MNSLEEEVVVAEAASDWPWRPRVFISYDESPLATRFLDLVPPLVGGSFPYDRLNEENWLLAWTMRPEFVLLSVLAYLASKPLLAIFVKSQSPAILENKTWLRIRDAAIAGHNLALAVFSGVVAANAWPVVTGHARQHGLMAAYCDADGTMWNQAGFGAWATIFYISKYYEFLDTWILILKGKKASFLQVYHHTGIALTMWGGVASHSSWLLWVVLLNSFIHTVMYTYFFFKTLYPSWHIEAAKYLTKAQIGQFMLGISGTMGVQVLGSTCDSVASRCVLAFIQLYVVGLIVLFVAFAKKKYKKP